MRITVRGLFERHGKRLFVQLQDVSFDERLNVPDYLVEDPAFGGGAARKYETDDDPSRPIFDGWVARRWDPAVIDRFSKLLDALGEQLDGRIEGLSLAETSPSAASDASIVSGPECVPTSCELGRTVITAGDFTLMLA